MAELLSYAETQKLLDELPREQQKLVADLIPSQITAGGVQRVLQALLAERVSIRDLPTILEGIQEACGGAARAIPAIVAHVRARLARQISDSHTGAGRLHPADHAVARLGGGVRRGAGRPAGRSPARDGAEQAAGVHAAAARRVRRRREHRRGAGAADLAAASAAMCARSSSASGRPRRCWRRRRSIRGPASARWGRYERRDRCA